MLSLPTIENQSVNDIKLSSLYISGLSTIVAPGNSHNVVYISPGECRDSTNSFNMSLNQPIVLDPAVVGVNGADVAAPSPSLLQTGVLFSIYLIGDSSGKLPTASIATQTINVNTTPPVPSVSPIMPTGYNMQRLIGYALCNTSSLSSVVLFASYTFGSSNFRKFVLNQSYNTLLIGTTNQSSATFNVSYIFPPVDATPIDLYMTYTGSVAGNTAVVNGEDYTAQVATNPLTQNIESIAVYNNVPGPLVVNVGTSNTADSLSLYFQGFDFCV